MMEYAVKVFALIFAVLHMVAAAVKLKRDGADLNVALMFAGTAIAAASAAVGKLDWAAGLAGGAIVCLAAYLNGKKSGKVNPLHHAVRAAVVALYTVGYIIW